MRHATLAPFLAMLCGCPGSVVELPDAACESCILEAGTPIDCAPQTMCDPMNDTCQAGTSCQQPCCDARGCLAYICGK